MHLAPQLRGNKKENTWKFSGKSQLVTGVNRQGGGERERRKAAGKGATYSEKMHYECKWKKEIVEIVEIDLTIVSLACYWRNDNHRHKVLTRYIYLQEVIAYRER